MGFERRLTDTLVIISLLLGLAASLVSAPEDLAASGTDYEEVCIESASNPPPHNAGSAQEGGDED